MIRFSPFSAAGVAKSARTSSRHYMDPDNPDEPKIYRSSVFADVRRPDETRDDLLGRLLKAAELSHMQMDRNKYFTIGEASTLLQEGFTFWKDGYEGEVSEHYSVDFGPEEPQEPDAERFLRAFPTREAIPEP